MSALGEAAEGMGFSELFLKVSRPFCLVQSAAGALDGVEFGEKSPAGWADRTPACQEKTFSRTGRQHLSGLARHRPAQVEESNAGAVCLYRSLGFEETVGGRIEETKFVAVDPEQAALGALPGEWVPTVNIVMRRDLDRA